MGWKLLRLNQLKTLCQLTLAAGLLALVGVRAQGQLFGGFPPIVIQDDPPTIDDAYTTVSNAYLTLGVGVNKHVCGAMGITTTQGNPTDPNNVLFEGWNQQSLVPKETEPPYAPYKGCWLYVRVDGGDKAGGADYIWGDWNKDGQWLAIPQVVGNHLEARWETVKPTTGTGTGSGSVKANPNIEVDLKASFIHNTVRFEWIVKNKNQGTLHTVGLAFVEDISVDTRTFFLDGPLRLPNQPYLHHEVMLPGALVPNKWETYNLITPASGTNPALVHSLRQILKPANGAQTEPTPPTRMLYGRVGAFPNIEGADLSTGSKVRNLDITWNFEKYLDTSLYFDRVTGTNTTDAGVVVYWDPETVLAGSQVSKITYLGQSDSEVDFTYPMSLSVNAPKSLGFVTDHTDPNKPVARVAPNPFTVTAYIQNLTDLSLNQYNSISSDVFINLPPGLILAPGETAIHKNLTSTPGVEAKTSWQVMLDPKNPRTGPLIISVSASPSIGSGKNVQVTIEVPAPTTIVLKSNKITTGLFEMKSFPLNFGGKTPSEVLGLPVPTATNGVTPQVDVLQWDPISGHYVSQNTWIPGFAYWIRYNPPDQTVDTGVFTIDAAKYPPLDGSVQPNAASYQVIYPRGWNQIGDPYVYELRFSETQVFDNDTLQLMDIGTAADTSHNLLLPAVYHYDSSDPNIANWHYELLENFGFQMLPGEGYWIRVNKGNLKFIYNGTDTPGGSVTKAALLGVGLGSTLGRGTDTNWRLRLNARGASSMDNMAYVGVAPKATDQPDSFKYSKPPMLNRSISLDIVHEDWAKENGRYAQDLRAPGPSVKTWDVTLTSPKPNEEVTITWPDIAASVPRTYRLTLVDKDTNDHRDLRGTSSYVVNTGAAASRHFQIVAQPTTRGHSVAITSFDVVTNKSKAVGVNSVAIHYTLSDSSETQVNIRDSRGRTVRTLKATTRAAGDGTNSGDTVWDVKDQQGVALPSGVYQAELVALGSDGQRSRQVKPVLIVR